MRNQDERKVNSEKFTDRGIVCEKVLIKNIREDKAVNRKKKSQKERRKQAIWRFQAKIEQICYYNMGTHCFIENFTFGVIVCLQIPEKKKLSELFT